jgi:hypothetical protein
MPAVGCRVFTIHAYANVVRGKNRNPSTEAFHGHLSKSHEYSRRAVDSELRADSKEGAAKAEDFTEHARPYELATPTDLRALYHSYVRGQAYLAMHRGNDAAVEFQRILDHRGLNGNSSLGALAHLQIGRAYAMSGDPAKARTAYQDFFALWKDAEPDIPILKQANAEYAKLQ